MKKLIAVVITIVIVLSCSASIALADKGTPNPSHYKEDGVGNSNNAFNRFYQLEFLPDGSYIYIYDGAWAKIRNNLAGPTFDFVFNGHGLPANTNYSLIVLNPTTIITTGTTDGGGNIHLAGSVEINRDIMNVTTMLYNPVMHLFCGDINYDDTDVP